MEGSVWMHDDFMDNGTREHRARLLLGAVLILFGVLGVRLYLLQIADWERYRIQSEKNTMQPVPLSASRGLILDRNGRVLVDNRPSYTISVIPPRLLRNTAADVRRRVVARLSETVGLSETRITRKLSSRKRHFYEPVKLRRDVGFAAVSAIEEDRYDLPGVEIQVEARRGYPAFEERCPVASHILGYVGLIDADEYPKMAPRGYSLDDQVGKRGVERLCEGQLRGQDGVKYIEVNARGREVGSFPERTEPPLPGRDINLTLDWDLQCIAESAFADTLKGSLVVMAPHSGEILAMVSRPCFHPSSIRNPREWQALQSDPLKPLLNRSLQGEYPPGSILKMVAAIAALEMGILDTDEVRYSACEGELALGDRVFGCHREEGHGELTLRQALVHSCDIFFYHLGREVGIANWSRYTRVLGFSQPTGIDIAGAGDGEANGLVTERAYYEARWGKWVEGFMLNLSIGQGETLVTPVQVARYTSALAVGALPTPYVLAESAGRAESVPVQVSAETLEKVRGMMRDVVGSAGGTGRRARVAGVQVGGKTGTAQNSHGEDHAWFVSIAPIDDPEVVVVAIAENAGQGSEIAAPICQKVLSAYFGRSESPPGPEVRVAASVSAVLLPRPGGVSEPAPALTQPSLSTEGTAR